MDRCEDLNLKQFHDDCDDVEFNKVDMNRVYTECPGGTCQTSENVNGYGDNGERKVWSSCGSTYCTCLAYCCSYTAQVRPSVSQPNQAHSSFIINRCYSCSEL